MEHHVVSDLEKAPDEQRSGESDVLRTTTDDYSVSVFDAAVVGRTDRFVLRFRKSLTP